MIERRRLPPRMWAPAAIVCACGVWLACGGPPAEAPPAVEPTAEVTVAPIRWGKLTETLIAYGTVIPAPGAAQTMTLPFESQVVQVLITAGQEVDRGQILVQLRPSPNALEEIAQARAALTAEELRMDATSSRYALGLATEDEVAERREALDSARVHEQRVAAWLEAEYLRAPAAGIVTSVAVGEGALVGAGEPLVELALENRFEIRLGIEPEDAHLVKPGSLARFAPLSRPAVSELQGSVRSVASQVSADTRLVEVLATPRQGSSAILLGESVRGELDVAGAEGLLVPRSALVVSDGRWQIFTVEAGRAARHEVSLGVETEAFSQVFGADLAEGDSVVVEGSAVLEDGMEVRVAAAGGSGARPAPPAADSPGSSSAAEPEPPK